MNPIERRYFLALQQTRRGDVCRQHALFNNLVRVVAHHGDDILDLAIFEYGACLGGLKLDGAAIFTRNHQHLIECIELLEVRHKLCILLAQLVVAIDQHGCDLIVGEARM